MFPAESHVHKLIEHFDWLAQNTDYLVGDINFVAEISLWIHRFAAL